jgi:hypothetical protein
MTAAPDGFRRVLFGLTFLVLLVLYWFPTWDAWPAEKLAQGAWHLALLAHLRQTLHEVRKR